MKQALIVIGIMVVAYLLSNPKEADRWIPTIQGKGDPSIAEMYDPLYRLVPDKSHDNLDRAKTETMRFKTMSMDPDANMVEMTRIKSHIMTYLNRCLFFLPNDLEKEVQIRTHIAHIEKLLQRYLYIRFGSPMDIFGYSSIFESVE